MMSTKSLVAVAAVTAALAASAGFPLSQQTVGWGPGVASASPCPPVMPCQGPPKPPKLPDGGGGGPKGPRVPEVGGGPKGPDFGGGPGPKGPDFGGGPGFNGPALRGPGDVRHAFTLGGPPAAASANVPGALRAPKDLRPDFRLDVPGFGRLTPDAHIYLGGPGRPPESLSGDFRVNVPWLARPRGHVDLNFHGPWLGRVPGDLRAGFNWRVAPADLRVEFRVGHLLDFSADWRGLRIRLGPPPWHGGLAPWGIGPAPWGWGPPPPPGLGRVDTAAVGAGSGTLRL